MNVYFIVGYSFLGLITIFGAIYLYSYWTYTKNTVFAKAKYSSYTWIFYTLIFILMLTLGILFLTIFKTNLEIKLSEVNAGLCFGFLFIDIVNIVLYVLIVQKNSKNKLDYKNLDGIDFDAKLLEIKNKIGNVDEFKVYLLKKHKKYFKALNEQYLVILKNAKDKNISKAEKIADIVLFSDNFSHKWSSKVNLYQLMLTYDFLKII